MLDWINRITDEQATAVLALLVACAAVGCFKGARFCHRNGANAAAFWLGMAGIGICAGLLIWGLSYLA